MPHIKTNPPRAKRHISVDLAAAIGPLREAAAKLKGRVSPFAIYDFLGAVYRAYVDWKRRKIAKRSVRTLADDMNIVRRKGMSPIRVLIEAILPNADFKQKSRWVRALQYVYSENVSPSQFRQFIHRHGGIAGCARLVVNVNRKRRRPGGDWND
jgi:hypothetical protein